MNDRFFRSYSNQQPSRTAQSVPKVVSVPIHFISSDQPRMTLPMLKDSSAIRIQRVVRGFLVRKNMKKIASIRNEVIEIERRIGDTEVVDMIRRDAKERLRVGETLMSLLLKLDSIRSVDCGIRDLRKMVTRRAVALQEKVDSMVQANVDDHQTLTLDSTNNAYSGKIDGNSEAVVDNDGVVKEINADCEAVKDADGCDAEDLSEMSKEVNVHRCVEGSMEVQQKVDDRGNREEFEKVMADNEKMNQKVDDRGNREEIEKLMADNEKMMKLMTQIFEKNEMQTRMINSLSRRVEQLEKAFMRKKKRKQV